MSKIFTRKFRVGWSDTNAIGQVHLSDYQRYVVETAWDWGEAVGLGMADSDELGLAWVIRESELNIHRPLRAHDEFDLTLWLAEWRRVRGRRCFELVLRDGGEKVADGVQEVVTLDSKTLRPAAAPPHLIDRLKIENPRLIPHEELPKPPESDAHAFVFKRQVDWRDLDPQEIVYNAHYADFAENASLQALDALGWPPSRFKAEGLAVRTRRLHLAYQAPAAWGELLDVRLTPLGVTSEGAGWSVHMQRASDREAIARCALRWSLVDRTSGEARGLPDSLSTALKERASPA
jgi:acyl-CoA thioester hydrolase